MHQWTFFADHLRIVGASLEDEVKPAFEEYIAHLALDKRSEPISITFFQTVALDNDVYAHCSQSFYNSVRRDTLSVYSPEERPWYARLIALLQLQWSDAFDDVAVVRWFNEQTDSTKESPYTKRLGLTEFTEGFIDIIRIESLCDRAFIVQVPGDADRFWLVPWFQY